MTILEQVERGAPRPRYTSFQPKTVPEFFALRLAAKLGDSQAAEHFLELVEQYSEAQILTAYRRAVAHGANGNLARRFHAELEPFRHRSHSDENGVAKHPLLAIRVERRAIAVAIFRDDHLAYTQPRQLSSTPGKAIASVIAFVERIVEQFAAEKLSIRSAALELIQNGHEIQRSVLQQHLTQTLEALSVNVMRVAKSELFEAFGHPPLTSRKELRAIASEIWPSLSEQRGSPWIHDAAILGLYVQTERLFIIN